MVVLSPWCVRDEILTLYCNKCESDTITIWKPSTLLYILDVALEETGNSPVTSPLRATVPPTVYNKYGSLLSVYLRLEQTMEPSFKPTVRRVWLSAENNTLRTLPLPYRWHCSWINCSCMATVSQAADGRQIQLKCYEEVSEAIYHRSGFSDTQ